MNLLIPARFNGPPGSANGGYTCGLVASYLDSAGLGTPVEVTLRRPPPLETPLDVTVRESTVEVSRGGTLVTSGTRLADWNHEDLPPVPFDAALDASKAYSGFGEHPFPTCFVCGPEREPGDGLRLFPGRVDPEMGVEGPVEGLVAAPWVVPPDVSRVLVWAALDCPGGWSVPLEARPYVLGRLAARVSGVPALGDECVVVGRMTGEEGRKAYAATTLYGPGGVPLASAYATWIAL